jgi:hypothetical protein
MHSIQQLIRHAAIAARIRCRWLKFSSQRNRQFRSLIRLNPTTDTACLACSRKCTNTVRFVRTEGTIDKNLCPGCGHLFSLYQQSDPELGRILFDFGSENDAAATQLSLLEETIRRSGRTGGTFLDFGVGGNISAFQQAQLNHPNAHIFACDTYPLELENYFQTYSDRAPLGIFDGISSYAVVEHLTETFDSWSRFNRLLKPVNEGGGIMVHAFPSLLHHDFDHWAIQIRSHTCLFSPKSLRFLCK